MLEICRRAFLWGLVETLGVMSTSKMPQLVENVCKSFSEPNGLCASGSKISNAP